MSRLLPFQWRSCDSISVGLKDLLLGPQEDEISIMSQSLSKILIHIIFSTKDRIPYLSEDIRSHLWRYMVGALDSHDSRAIQIGGTADHVHVLARVSKNIAVCKLVEEVKKESSKWIKKRDANLQWFCWQVGYGAFSIGESGVPATQGYILRQEEHHRKVSFQEEYRRFLARYDIPFDERYIWE